MKKLVIQSLLLSVYCLINVAFASQDQCQSGMIRVDHQCINLGNKVNISFSKVFSVNIGYTVLPGKIGQTEVEIIGSGYSSQLEGKMSSPGPLTVNLVVKEEASSKLDRSISQLGRCYQAALLAMSGKEKYLFTINLASNNSISDQILSGSDGKLHIAFDPGNAAGNRSLTLVCGNSLKTL